MQIKLLIPTLFFWTVLQCCFWQPLQAQDTKVKLDKNPIEEQVKAKKLGEKETNDTLVGLSSGLAKSIQENIDASNAARKSITDSILKASKSLDKTATKATTPSKITASKSTDSEANDLSEKTDKEVLLETTEDETAADESDSTDLADAPEVEDTDTVSTQDQITQGLKQTIGAIVSHSPVIKPSLAPSPEQDKILKFDVQLLKEAGSDTTILELSALTPVGNKNKNANGVYYFSFDDAEPKGLNFVNGLATDTLTAVPELMFVEHYNGVEKLSNFYRIDNEYDDPQTSVLPQWIALVPPLVAIVLALLLREVFFSLFFGVFLGALLINGFSWQGALQSFFRVVDKYIITAISNPDHIAIIVFSLLIGGMVAIISRNGGMAGVVQGLSFFARGPRSSQFITWLLGIAIFFDDYANTLIVGNTMRSVTDKYRVSREKLAYIVDSTAAPVAAIALVTTWIGAELGYIGDATAKLGITEQPYSIFLNSLQYAFYPVLTLFFILLLIIFQRDYGAMWNAEVRARATGKLTETGVRKKEELDDAMEELSPVSDIGHYAHNAILPILTVIAVTMWGLYTTGYDAAVMNDETLTNFDKMTKIVGDADSYKALLWSSISGVLVATFLSVFGGFLSLRASMESLAIGIKTMMPAIVILVLAWSLAQITQELRTADFLTSLLEGNLDPKLLPLITFVLSAFIAFATGSSWSTMAILYPILLPTTWTICQSVGMEADIALPIFYNVTASVLGGSVLGDHCSPISDTTILSSLSTGCNHIDHVSTQLHYAITVGVVSLLVSGISIYANLPVWANFGIGAGILLLVVLIGGRRVHSADYYQPDEPENPIDENASDDDQLLEQNLDTMPIA